MLLGVVPSRTAWAEDADAANLRAFREQYERAGRAYSAKDYTTAIPALQAAFALQPVPQILFNIGQAHRKLEQFGAARAYFELYKAMAKDLTPALADQVDIFISEMEELERAQRTPQIVEKTKLLYVQQEKPLPRWLRPLGLTSGLLGLGTLGAGAALLGIDGSCTSAPEPPALECNQLYGTGPAGKVLIGIGSVAFVTGVVMFSLSFKKPARPAVHEVEAPPPSKPDEMPSLQQILQPTGQPDGEPAPAGWNADGTRNRGRR